MQRSIDKLTGLINSSLIAGLKKEEDLLHQSLFYALEVKGKRLRPLLFLTLVEGRGHDPLKYMDIACAIEYIHTYTLIHDDLPAMDNDDFRRGMPTVHCRFNEAVAILAGNSLLTLAFEKIASAPLADQIKINLILILTKAIGKDGLALGQTLDLHFDNRPETIHRIHLLKTAKLIEATLLCGGEITLMTPTNKSILSEIGIAIGLAFQMVDDLLDIDGNEAEVGKKIHKDKSNQSPNSVIHFGRDHVLHQVESHYQKALDGLQTLQLNHPPFLYLMEKMVHRAK